MTLVPQRASAGGNGVFVVGVCSICTAWFTGSERPEVVGGLDDAAAA